VAQYEADPLVAVLRTHGDDTADWLRAGIALQHILLEATLAGLAVSMMTQPLEFPDRPELYDDAEVAELDELYDELLVPSATQKILRLGYAPRSSPTRRRPVEDVLVAGLEQVPALPSRVDPG
jgi:hypothetical protein